MCTGPVLFNFTLVSNNKNVNRFVLYHITICISLQHAVGLNGISLFDYKFTLLKYDIRGTFVGISIFADPMHPHAIGMSISTILECLTLEYGT